MQTLKMKELVNLFHQPYKSWDSQRGQVSTRILRFIKIECMVLSKSYGNIQFHRNLGANTKTALASEPDLPTLSNLGLP